VLRLPPRPADRHLVDDVDLVGCPRRACDVTVGECLRCPSLRQVIRVDGAPVEILCEPAPPSAPHRWMGGLLWS
jgi:hypothetical protein